MFILSNEITRGAFQFPSLGFFCVFLNFYKNHSPSSAQQKNTHYFTKVSGVERAGGRERNQSVYRSLWNLSSIVFVIYSSWPFLSLLGNSLLLLQYFQTHRKLTSRSLDVISVTKSRYKSIHQVLAVWQAS